MPTPVLEATDLSVSFAGRPVVRRVDLRVRRGEFLTLLGANGSGKSTLVRACVGLLPAATGRVQLFGTELAEVDDWSRVGYVPQRSTAASGVPATVAEVVTTGRLSRRRRVGWPSRRDRLAVQDRLEQLGLADRAKEAVTHLSGGQQQRVLIARALAGDPELLVMDEPVAGVDAHSQGVLARVFADLIASGAAVLLVAHELGALAPLVDHVVLLRDGRVAYDGAPQSAPERSDPGHDEHHAHSRGPRLTTGLPGEGPWR